jgi:indole-3-acetate monooxygenase
MGRGTTKGSVDVTEWRLVDDAHSLGELIETNAAAGERDRRLADDVVEAMRARGLLRMCVPAAYGGPEADPLTMIAAIEALAMADGAAGWCAMIATTTSTMAAYLPDDGAKEIFGDPGSAAVGVFAPNGKADRDGDDFRVDGRWNWGSGSQHAQWICGGAIDADGDQHLMFFPASDVTIHDTWFTSGLRGSGSNEFSVTGALAPLRRTMQPGVTKPVVDTPLAHFPNFTLLSVGVAAVSLGIARRALNELVEFAESSRPQFSRRTIAEHASAQTELARAESTLRAARAFVHDEVSNAWSRATSGLAVDVATRGRIRLAAAHATEAAVAATTTAYTLGGGASVYESSALQRCLRDVHVPTQHIMVNPRMYETLGKLCFGIDIDARML